MTRIIITLGLLTSAFSISSHGRPVALATSPDGSHVLAAIESPAVVKAVEIKSGEVRAEFKLPAKPTGMALSPDGARLFVTAGLAPGRLLVLDVKSGAVQKDIPAGHSPCGPVVSNDGSRVFVCNRFEDEVLVIDPNGGQISGRFPVVREPKAAVLGKDGKALFVANHLPAGPANTGSISAELSVIDLASGESKTIRLPNGSTGFEGLAISPDGAFVYATHTLARYGLPTTQLDRGWMNTSAVSVIDAKAARFVAAVLLDNVDLGAANPWGVGCSPDGSRLFVAHAGTHELSVIDRPALHEKIARAEKGERVTEVSDSAADIANDLSFLVGIRERRKLTGVGTRAVAPLADGRCAVGGYFSGTVHLVADGKQGAIQDIKLVEVPLNDPVSRGELLFHDARQCFQHWQSCSSCHPGVRVDALNWDLLNDGIGNPKQAKSMLFTMQTPPSMISAVRADGASAVAAGFRHIQFAVPTDEDVKAVAEFIKALQPVPSPALAGGKLSPAAERGKLHYQKAGCAFCHSGPYFTDLGMHDVGTGSGREKGMKMDTPTLREVWRSAPYLHDGRAATLDEMMGKYNPGDRHGKTSWMSEVERGELVEYLRSL